MLIPSYTHTYICFTLTVWAGPATIRGLSCGLLKGKIHPKERLWNCLLGLCIIGNFTSILFCREERTQINQYVNEIDPPQPWRGFFCFFSLQTYFRDSTKMYYYLTTKANFDLISWSTPLVSLLFKNYSFQSQINFHNYKPNFLQGLLFVFRA